MKQIIRTVCNWTKGLIGRFKQKPRKRPESWDLPRVVMGQAIPELPDEFLTWEGKERGAPKPGLIFYGGDSQRNSSDG